MKPKESVTDFKYIESEIEKISTEYNINPGPLMNVFNMMMLSNSLDAKDTLERIRMILSMDNSRQRDKIESEKV
jgi:hypothetical protein